MLEILDFIEEHKKAVIAVCVMVLCLLISGGISGRFVKARNEAQRQLQNVENNIATVEDQLKQPITKFKELDHGYHKSRVDRDKAILEGKGTGPDNTNEWFSRFLTWSSGREYVENRNWFIEKLGASNIFCTDIMRSYDPDATSMGQSGILIDPDKVTCKLSSVDLYVNSIDENNNIYNYVAFVTFSGSDAFTNKAFNAIDNPEQYVIMVSVDGEGNVLPDTFVVATGPTKRFG